MSLQCKDNSSNKLQRKTTKGTNKTTTATVQHHASWLRISLFHSLLSF